MSDETSEPKPKKHVEHIAISEASSQKITNWIEQVQARKKGVRITRKDFLNWRLEEYPDVLSSKDLNALIERFYDEESLLRQLLRDVKKAKKMDRLSLCWSLWSNPESRSKRTKSF